MANYLIPPASYAPVFIGTVSSSASWGAVDFYTSTASVSVAAIGWYRGSTTGPGAIQVILRDTVTNTDVVTLTAPDDSLIGWHYVNLVTPWPLIVGRIYRVAFTCSGGFQVYRGPLVTPDAPFLYEVSRYGDNWPNLVGTTTDEQSVSVSDTPISGPATPGDTTTIITTPGPAGEQLAPWLSADSTTQTHETDGLPWLTKVVADVTKNAVDATKIVVDATKAVVDELPKSSDPMWEQLLSLWKIAGVLTEAEIDLWNLFAKRAPGQLTGSTPGGGSAFFGPSGGQVAERAEVAGFNSELLWHRTRTSNWLEPVPGEDWDLVDTLEWSGPVGWDQPADCYVLNLTTVPDYVTTAEVAGHNYYPKAAWWAPLTGTLPHERRFVDFETQLLHALPMRCEGILLCPRNNFAGTLQAWLRPTAPAP
jgi:hypothetical protein